MPRGYLVTPGDLRWDDEEGDWETLCINAIGNIIEFWGFKHNHGRVWALLFLRGVPMTAAAIQEDLGLSKGAVSMITRELEQYDVIHRVRVRAKSASWHFVAETRLQHMIGRVLKEREARIFARVKSDLDRAHQLADDDQNAASDTQFRVSRLAELATLMDSGLSTFVQTARFDMNAVLSLLKLASMDLGSKDEEET